MAFGHILYVLCITHTDYVIYITYPFGHGYFASLTCSARPLCGLSEAKGILWVKIIAFTFKNYSRYDIDHVEKGPCIEMDRDDCDKYV